MRTIRYFGQLVDPAVYRRGFGVWGWLVNFLNPIRMWIEKRMVLAILRIECTRAGLTKKAVKAIVRQAAEHPSFVPVLGGDVPRFVRKLMREQYPIVHQSTDARSEARYGEGRKNSDGPTRPMPFEQGMRNTFAQTAMKSDRSARYVPGRKFFVDMGEHVEAVPSSRSHMSTDEKHDPQPLTPAEQAGHTAPQPQLSPAEIKKRIAGADFALGAGERHLRLPGGLQKNGK